MRKLYEKPELICYSGIKVGVYSVSNSNANCQADCAATVCSFVATASAAPCDTCDNDNSQCATGLNPVVDCL
ncbi:MAG: hypothetical protein AAB229_05495 [Candidatus Hydrogenedentota bacterium]